MVMTIVDDSSIQAELRLYFLSENATSVELRGSGLAVPGRRRRQYLAVSERECAVCAADTRRQSSCCDLYLPHVRLFAFCRQSSCNRRRHRR